VSINTDSTIDSTAQQLTIKDAGVRP